MPLNNTFLVNQGVSHPVPQLTRPHGSYRTIHDPEQRALTMTIVQGFRELQIAAGKVIENHMIAHMVGQ